MPIVEGMGEVEETNVMIGVKFNAGGVEHFGGFSTNLLISSEVGLTQGREIHGQPKKMGSTKIKTVNNEIVAEVFRGNALISRVVMPVSKQAAQVSELEKYFPFRENINHKVIRNIDGTQGINQITSRILGDVVVKECWRGPSKLTIEFNESAPFHLLPVLPFPPWLPLDLGFQSSQRVFRRCDLKILNSLSSQYHVAPATYRARLVHGDEHIHPSSLDVPASESPLVALLGTLLFKYTFCVFEIFRIAPETYSIS
jgi:hypothetical protein